MTTIDTDGFLSDEADDGKQILRAKHPSVFDVAYGLNTVAVQKLGCAKLSECTDPQFVLYLLAIRVIEAFEAVVLLSERGMIASAKLVIRPQLEAVFTLAAIDRDSGLVDRYFDAHTHAQYQRLRASKDWQAPKLKTIFETDKLGAKLKEAEAARKKAPPKTLKPYEWAGLAEMSDYSYVGT